MPATWRQGITAWQLVFLLCVVYLGGWAIDHYILGGMRDIVKTLGELEKAAKELTCTVGSQHNRIEELVGKTRGMQDYMHKTLKDLASQIQNNLPEQGTSKESVENPK